MKAKDFDLIAMTIAHIIERDDTDSHTIDLFINELTQRLLVENPKFKSHLFIKAIHEWGHRFSYSLYRDRKTPRVDAIIPHYAG